MKRVLPLAILGVGFLGALVLVATRPSIELEPAERVAPLVRVMRVEPRDVQLSVRTHGTVVPRTASDLTPEISGPVLWVAPSLVSGGFFEADDVLLRVDPRDYEVVLERARAQLARAQSENVRAERQLERSRGLKERNFASDSQLDDAVNAYQVARADLREARALLNQAERDLQRTELQAPYRGRVREETVDVGQFVTRGAPIARLYAIDYVEVRLPVADEELAFLDLPLWSDDGARQVNGSEVILRAHFAGANHEWTGRVVRTEGEIDPQSRMVHVIARVEDPYARTAGSDRPPLAVGLFVEAEILGRSVADAIVVPRASMYGRDRVLVVDAEDRLRIRPAEVLRAGRDEVVLASGARPYERVVTSVLSAVVDGMQVRTLPSEGVAAERRSVAAEPAE